MKKLIRKTITIPENIYRQAKVNAAYCNESFSAYVAGVMEEKLFSKKKKQTIKNPFRSMGVFTLPVKKLPARYKLYEGHLRRKMGI